MKSLKEDVGSLWACYTWIFSRPVGGCLSLRVKASTPFVEHCFNTNVGLSLHLQWYRSTVPSFTCMAKPPPAKGHNSTYTTNGHISVITVSPG